MELKTNSNITCNEIKPFMFVIERAGGRLEERRSVGVFKSSWQFQYPAMILSL